ncbi:ATP-dependent acyl-CoA ligase [Sporosarcina sp. P21c]|uniref:AMP-binding protein n=1 Tax=unclassified Sporosarcina TaxID=2647733 RepID=UPI000C1692A0|nr:MULTISPECIES: AMP-binding protein [unclassified Sporosarcina]PIC67269.1 ATP-dependent acyl-CoA ligase [Sporosarcina sp. P16a]PIC90213.1 ATP-dependent acyl-CoA ligase [Sporosarcina sp. P21c]PIC92721.1 ATP-dependent acyl-CoA ligase [Sporosarcina sp. P25]
MDCVGERTLRDLLNEKLHQHPDKTLFLFEDADRHVSQKTYREFEDEVDRLSRYFLHLGIRKGEHVTLHMPNNLEFYTIWFALANIGAIMVPTNILSPTSEMNYIISNSDSVMLITEQPYLDKFTDLGKHCPAIRYRMLTRSQPVDGYFSYDDALIFESGCKHALPELHNEDTVAILYTSGTTSKPKGVCVTHANYLFVGEQMALNLQLTANDRTFIVLPLFHGNAQYYSTMSALTVGASIALTEKFSASRYFEQANQLQATVGSLFAAPIRMILAKNESKNVIKNTLHTIIFAQNVAAEQLNRFKELADVRLSQLYGMTETIGIPLMNPLHSVCKNESIGRPTLAYEVKLVDEQGNEVQKGASGQILVKGHPGRTIMKKYLRNQLATEETIQDGWLRTGDNARIGEDGYYYFVDRVKDMIKRSGENVATIEVESALASHQAVYEAAVIGVPDDMRDEAIKAFVILNEEMYVTENELLAHCQAQLAKFKVPDSIDFLDDFPRTSVGKIQKNKLVNYIPVK